MRLYARYQDLCLSVYDLSPICDLEWRLIARAEYDSIFGGWVWDKQCRVFHDDQMAICIRKRYHEGPHANADTVWDSGNLGRKEL